MSTRRFRLPLRAPHTLDALLVAAAVALLLALLATHEVAPPALGEGTLVVADLRGHALTVLDLQSGERRRIELTGGPHELLRLPDGRVAASLEQAGRLAIVDPADSRVVYVETGGLPHGLALDGGTLLVTDRAAGLVRRFEVGTWLELSPTAAGTLPHAVALDRDGSLLVADAASDWLALGRAGLVPQPALTESIAVSADLGRVAVAGARDGRILIYDASGRTSHEVRLGGRPVRLAFDPAGITLAAALSAAGEVALLDTSGGVRRIAVPGVPDGLAFDSAGRSLFVSDMAGGAVSAIDAASGRRIAVLDGGLTAGALLLLP